MEGVGAIVCVSRTREDCVKITFLKDGKVVRFGWKERQDVDRNVLETTEVERRCRVVAEARD